MRSAIGSSIATGRSRIWCAARRMATRKAVALGWSALMNAIGTRSRVRPLLHPHHHARPAAVGRAQANEVRAGAGGVAGIVGAVPRDRLRTGGHALARSERAHLAAEHVVDLQLHRAGP